MPAVRAIASSWAARWQCALHHIDSPRTELIRVRNGEVCIYECPVTGVMLSPHPDAEPIRLEFDTDLYMQHFCKTQFAPAQVHVEVIGLLRELAPLMEDFSVEDEGGYWETGDLQHLEEQLARGLALIRMVAAHGGALVAPHIADATGDVDPLKRPRWDN